MAHNTDRSGYSQLVDRLNRFPQGAVPSKLLFRILEMLFSEREASLVSLLPIKPFTAEKAGHVWKMDLSAAQTILDNLAERGILVDIERDGQYFYVLPPPMAGFFEFSMMRVRHDIDQKVLSELFYEYLNVEEEFIRNLFTRGETQLGRVFVNEEALSDENALHVLDYERATEVIKTASRRAVGICYCRHKMQHMGRACNAPMEICMTFNTVASSLIRHGIAREIDSDEGIDLLNEAYENNLVQFGENVHERVNFICNCCRCCCEAMIAARRFAILNPVHTTCFMPEVNASKCTGCSACVDVCPVEAMTLVSSNDPCKPKGHIAMVDEERCLGCGLCARACTRGSICLKPRPARVITPVNGTHRAVVMAVERGNLQDLIFDNRVLLSHRALAAVLGVILKLPPVKQALAERMLKSRYLKNLIEKMSNQ